METEHKIIVALLVVIIYMLSTSKTCTCGVSQGTTQGFTEGFEDIMTGAWIRKRGDAEQGGSLGLVTNTTETGMNPNAWIRNRQDEQGFGLQRVQNRHHNMYQSQLVKHHLKKDHRNKMMRNMMGESGPDGAGAYSS